MQSFCFFLHRHTYCHCHNVGIKNINISFAASMDGNQDFHHVYAAGISLGTRNPTTHSALTSFPQFFQQMNQSKAHLLTVQ
jgi:hypothetical protein